MQRKPEVREELERLAAKFSGQASEPVPSGPPPLTPDPEADRAAMARLNATVHRTAARTALSLGAGVYALAMRVPAGPARAALQEAYEATKRASAELTRLADELDPGG